uniref:Putative secreted protein n=1 Tax=Anopheles darlingi TaxID=43151 RepID=A0A2M4DAF1_ANODA
MLALPIVRLSITYIHAVLAGLCVCTSTPSVCPSTKYYNPSRRATSRDTRRQHHLGPFSFFHQPRPAAPVFRPASWLEDRKPVASDAGQWNACGTDFCDAPSSSSPRTAFSVCASDREHHCSDTRRDVARVPQAPGPYRPHCRPDQSNRCPHRRCSFWKQYCDDAVGYAAAAAVASAADSVGPGAALLWPTCCHCVRSLLSDYRYLMTATTKRIVHLNSYDPLLPVLHLRLSMSKPRIGCWLRSLFPCWQHHHRSDYSARSVRRWSKMAKIFRQRLLRPRQAEAVLRY